ncbi:MAG: LytR C-terminal domain-containing protein [Nocardioidaceae bacterium]
MTTPMRPPQQEDDGQGTGVALARLFLLQLLAVAAITALLTTVTVVIGRGTGSDQVTTATQGSPSTPAAASPRATSSSSSASRASAAPPPSSAPPATPPASPPPVSPSATVDTSRPEVVVLNQSARQGAAADAADRLRGAGWAIRRTDSFSGNVRTTTVYYPPGMEQAARTVAKTLPGATRVLPRFSTLPRTRLTVVLTDDYQP